MDTRHMTWLHAAFLVWISFMLVACGGGSGSASSGSGTGSIAAAVSITSVQPTTPVAGQEIMFSANGSGNGTPSYAWSFGDGQVGTGASTAHTYSKSGTFTVVITITDSTGSTASGNATLVVSVAPVSATISGVNPTSPLNGQQISLTGSGSGNGALTYSWNFGDGSAAGSSATINHTYATAGTYAVTLTVIDSAGTSKTATSSITVQQDSPTASVSASTTSPDVSETVTFTGTGTGSGTLSYSWNFGDGSAAATGASITHAYAMTGGYTVRLNITDSLGHSGQAIGSISVASNAPTAAISPALINATVGTAITLGGVGTGQGALSYSWNFGDGTATATGVSPTHAFAATGNYTVTLTVTDVAGLNATASDVVSVSPHPLPAASIVSVGSNPVAGQLTNFSGSASAGTGPYTYAWSFGDGATGTGATPSHTYAASGSYTVSLSVTDSTSTTSTAVTASVSVMDPPAPSALSITPSSPTPPLNVATSFTATASGANPLTDSWTFGDGSAAATGTNVTHTYTMVGTYTVTLTVTDPFGQTATATASVAVTAGTLSLLAGSDGGAGSLNGTGANARFAPCANSISQCASAQLPEGAAVDGSGNVYVADTNNDTIRKITPAGVVTTFAGTAGVQGSADGTGATAGFYSPTGIAADGSGNLYVADSYNCTIRKITSAGVVTTLAGLARTCGFANGTGSAAHFNYPEAVAVDGSGNVYVADTNNYAIREVTPAGVVTTLAGKAGSRSQVDGTGAAAFFEQPAGIALDSAGNIYVADYSSIRLITPAAVVTTMAGTRTAVGHADGTGAAATFYEPEGIAMDSAGNVYVGDTRNDAVRKITPAGVVSTLAGSCNPNTVDVCQPGYANGTGSAAGFTFPGGLALDSVGNIYVMDKGNSTVRKISPAGAVSSLAGSGDFAGSADGSGLSASFNAPNGIATDSAGNMYVADTANDTIRKISPAGVVSTVAGMAGVAGYAYGTGTAASFDQPQGVAVDSSGNLYVADSINDTIRMITPASVVTTLAGTARQTGSGNGSGAAVGFNFPTAIAVDSAGNVYVADTNNDTIRKITSAGVVTTIAGTVGGNYDADGTGAAAAFNQPNGIALDSAGNIYVADSCTIRKITPTAVVTTLAGSALACGSADGTGTAAGFNRPQGLTVDSSDNLLVADHGNDTIRKITPAGVVTTVVGMAGIAGVQFSLLPAVLDGPRGVALTPAGKLLITDGNGIVETSAGL